MTGIFWWAARGVSTVYSLLQRDLTPSYGFSAQTGSAVKSDAFLLGEALTHWFAQKHLKTNVVAPLERHTGTAVMAGVSTSWPKSMPKHFNKKVFLGPKSEPDFLAFSKKGAVHVLESKGRCGFTWKGLSQKEINAARNKALRQVCRIATVNGVAPVTRTACVFGFEKNALIGHITDPPEIEQYDYRVDLPTLVKQAYGAVLNEQFERYARPFNGDFLAVEFADGWNFGIHKGVYQRVRNARDDRGVEGLLSYLEELGGEAGLADGGSRRRPGGAVSIGPDGFILGGGFDIEDPTRGWWHLS